MIVLTKKNQKYFSNQMLELGRNTHIALSVAQNLFLDIKILLSSPISEKTATEKKMITDFCVSMVDLAEEVLTKIEGSHEIFNSNVN